MIFYHVGSFLSRLPTKSLLVEQLQQKTHCIDESRMKKSYIMVPKENITEFTTMETSWIQFRFGKFLEQAINSVFR